MESHTNFKFFIMDVEKKKPLSRDTKVFRKYFVDKNLDPD